MTSPPQPVTTRTAPVSTSTTRGRGQVLLRYAAAATAVRTADAGAGVGLLLVVAAELPDEARTGGLLVAGFTLPHLAGPLLARRLDLATDARRLLGLAYAAVALCLAVAAWGLGRVPTWAVALTVLLAGFGGPLLTGGLSSRLSDLAASGEQAQRRAQGLDATSYGVAAALGPALVGAVAGTASPQVAVTCLAVLCVVSAVLVQTLPAVHPRPPEAVPGVRQVLPLVVTDPPLRRVNALTMVTAAAQAGLAVVVVGLAGPLHVRPSTTAVLLAVSGLGNLAASLVLTARPLRGDPDRLTTRHVAVLAACFGLCALAPSLGWAVAAFALMGIATAPFVTATFAARTAYAPAEARGQVFVTLAALKVGAASGGTALAGLLVGIGPRATLVVAGSAVLLAAAASVLDRRRSGRGSAPEVSGRA